MHQFKQRILSFFLACAAAASMVVPAYAITPKGVSNAFTENWDDISGIYDTTFGWDNDNLLTKEWENDGDYERQAGYQEEWYQDNVLLTKQYLGIFTGGMGGSGDNIVEVALSQLGLEDSLENPPNSNYVKYNDWYWGSHVSADWCAAFVCWCANECGLLGGTIPRSASCSAMFNMLKEKGYAYYPVSSTTQFGGSSYSPVPGDLMFFSDTGNLLESKPFQHIGIIVEVEEDGWYTVEGNTTGGGQIPGEGVAKNHFTKSSSTKRARNGYIVHVEYPEPQTGGTVDGNSNTEKVFNFLTATLGLNTATACGIMANIANESGFDPGRHEDKVKYGDGLGEGFGLCQWSYGRKTKLLEYLSSNGYAEDSIDGQLWYFKVEVESSESAAWSAIQNLPNTADGAYEAGKIWCQKFERSGNPDDAKTRGELAKNTYWPTYKNQ